MNKYYEINWRDEVYRSVDIDATSKEEAFEKWVNGDWETKNMTETDCQGLSDKDEIMSEITQIE